MFAIQKRFLFPALVVAFTTFSLAAHAQVTIDAPWVRATVPAQKATGVFMTIKSKDPVALVEAKSSAANIVEIHEMKTENGVMKMRAIDRLLVSEDAPGMLKPGGHHIMLIDLKAQVKEGDSVPLTLVFEDKNKKRTTLEVKAPARKRAPDAHRH